jgi:hypothetical protein
VTFAKVFDDRGLHGELHPVEGYEPDDILKRLRLAIENYGGDNLPRPKQYQSKHRKYRGSS